MKPAEKFNWKKFSEEMPQEGLIYINKDPFAACKWETEVYYYDAEKGNSILESTNQVTVKASKDQITVEEKSLTILKSCSKNIYMPSDYYWTTDRAKYNYTPEAYTFHKALYKYLMDFQISMKKHRGTSVVRTMGQIEELIKDTNYYVLSEVYKGELYQLSHQFPHLRELINDIKMRDMNVVENKIYNLRETYNDREHAEDQAEHIVKLMRHGFDEEIIEMERDDLIEIIANPRTPEDADYFCGHSLIDKAIDGVIWEDRGL